MCHLRPLQWHCRRVMLPSDSYDMPKAGWFGCGSGVVRAGRTLRRRRPRDRATVSIARTVQHPVPVFLPFLPIGASSVGIRPLLSRRTGEFSDSTCGPADSEPEADVVDRHAKSGRETSKHISVQNKSCSLLEIACTHIRLCSKREAQRQSHAHCD